MKTTTGSILGLEPGRGSPSVTSKGSLGSQGGQSLAGSGKSPSMVGSYHDKLCPKHKSDSSSIENQDMENDDAWITTDDDKPNPNSSSNNEKK